MVFGESLMAASIPAEGIEVVWPKQQKSQHYDEGEAPEPVYFYQRDGPRRILGLRIPTFWLIIAVIVLVLACGIGGGVAGGLVAQKHSWYVLYHRQPRERLDLLALELF